jgi:hypothetical protein
VVRGRCEKCGERQTNIIKRIFGEGPLIERTKSGLDPKKYRRRINRGDDIP